MGFLDDLRNAIGEELHELDETEYNKTKHLHKDGYVFEDSHIIALTLATYHHAYKELNKLPESIIELTRLKDLKLIDCRELFGLPESIGTLENLNILDCSGCRSLKMLPNNIGFLKNLEYLDLTKCLSLTQLPSSITELENIKSLILSNCQSLTSLPQNLGDLTSLRVLDLEYCRSLKKLPEDITNLPNLEILRLKSCHSMEKLPKEIGNLQTLKNIELDGCIRLSSIPESFSELELLDSLDLSHCYSLIELPSSIGTMKNLISLVLRGCRALKTLPDEFRDLHYLENLNLYACGKIDLLPDTIKKMSSLNTLDLSYCDKLSNFPEKIKDMPSLKVILTPMSDKENLSTEKNGDIIPDELDDIGLRIYQEKYQDLENLPKYEPDITDEYLKEGIIAEEAKIMNHFSVIAEAGLVKAEFNEDLFESTDDMHAMFYFRLNNDGHVIELYLHFAEQIYLSIIPRLLCSLKQLEVIYFPNNLIKEVPEWITNLKFLRELEISNCERRNIDVPDTIKSYIKSLERFRIYYR
ncbi:MAG: leucine-rich repeat domain-containing protein [Promethearchaeota archaeon]